MKITETEMRGLITGKAMPANIFVGESLAAYLVRKFTNLHTERDALAAENRALKEFFSVGISAAFDGCDWYGDDIQGKALELGLIREEKYDHETHAESVFNPEDFQQGDAVFTINETPATDAYLNSVRAEGVEMFAAHQRAMIGNAHKNDAATSYAARCAVEYAAILRAGEPS